MFDEVHWPMKLPEMDAVFCNSICLDKHVCAFVHCLEQFNNSSLDRHKEFAGMECNKVANTHGLPSISKNMLYDDFNCGM